MNRRPLADPTGFWKQVALVCVAVMVAGAPGIGYAIRTWGIHEDVKTIRVRQDDVRIRLGVLEVQQRELQAQTRELRALLAQHANNERSGP